MVKAARKLIGATNPNEAEPGTIRGDLAVEARNPSPAPSSAAKPCLTSLAVRRCHLPRRCRTRRGAHQLAQSPASPAGGPQRGPRQRQRGERRARDRAVVCGCGAPRVDVSLDAVSHTPAARSSRLQGTSWLHGSRRCCLGSASCRQVAGAGSVAAAVSAEDRSRTSAVTCVTLLSLLSRSVRATSCAAAAQRRTPPGRLLVVPVDDVEARALQRRHVRSRKLRARAAPLSCQCAGGSARSRQGQPRVRGALLAQEPEADGRVRAPRAGAAAAVG